MKKILLIISIVLTSCATQKPTGKTQAEILFKEAKELMSDSRYLLATEKLNRLRAEHPYSFYAVPAELLLADILYKQENYVESAAAYIVFKDFHPKHKKMPYVVYKIAESFYKQIPDTYDRDLESAYESIRFYQLLLSSYPKSDFIKDANKKIKKAKKMIASKEKYIADFYFKTENYDAALWRYKDILANIKDMNIVRHAMVRVAMSSLYAKKYKECIHFTGNFIPIMKNKNLKKLQNIDTECRKKIKK
ncbi:MAG: outer membrane protein assembly factor BamD [Bacteriovoracaceae bacterium]|jgi:outer membrane protein assembly factor BamD|nr:outer membrane protein assembly factor BamD [Bacteriovoracaceae bacterium]